MLPSQRAFQKQIYDRLLLYFRLARLKMCIRDRIDTVVGKIESVTREEVMEIARKGLEWPYAAAAVGRKVDTLQLK